MVFFCVQYWFKTNRVHVPHKLNCSNQKAPCFQFSPFIIADFAIMQQNKGKKYLAIFSQLFHIILSVWVSDPKKTKSLKGFHVLNFQSLQNVIDWAKGIDLIVSLKSIPPTQHQSNEKPQRQDITFEHFVFIYTKPKKDPRSHALWSYFLLLLQLPALLCALFSAPTAARNQKWGGCACTQAKLFTDENWERVTLSFYHISFLLLP